MAQNYLTEKTGGSVSIAQASLSIFEGLRLDGLRISTVESGKPTPLFEAKSLQVHFDLKRLLSGHLEAEQVLALEPHVYLVEDVDRKLWSFQKLERRAAPTPPGGPPAPTMATELPEVLVRDARIDYAQIINGRRSEVGTLNFEGQLAPDQQNLYRFRMQSRGGMSATFPIAEGWLKPDGSQVGLVVRDVEFVDEIKTILPAVVRRFWEEHQLAGRMAQTRVNYFRKPDGSAGFKVETVLDNVQLTLPPSAWMGPEDSDRVARWQSACRIIASPVMGGSPVAAAIGNAMTPSGLQFDQVDGTFVFTDENIQIRELVARFENNRFKVVGRLAGYDPRAAMDVRIESLKTQNIFIPESPAYIASMPWPVQEIYYRFHPQGGCSFWFRAHRETGERKPVLDGEVVIKDASFTFDRVPYPLQHGYGTFRLYTDPATSEQALELVGIRCRGFDGGANANANVLIAGIIQPLDERAGVKVRVTGKGVRCDPRLIQSLPPMTRAAVEGLDPKKTGRLPAFDADFAIDIHRPVGVRQPTATTASLTLTHAEGMVEAFPYPIRDATAQVTVFDDHLELTRLSMKRGDAALELSGNVNWLNHDARSKTPLIQPDLKLTATNVPIDDDLLSALPAQKGMWLRKAGLTGRIDAAGTIGVAARESEETTLDLAVALHHGTQHLPGMATPLTDITATGRMTASGMTITDYASKFEKADIHATGTIRWDKPDPSASAAVRATGVAIDDALLSLLPEESRKGLAGLAARGTIDADLDYATAEQTDYRLAIHPKTLEMTPDFFPVTLKQIAGEIVIDPQRVRLVDVFAQHDKAVVKTSGTIDRKTGIAKLSLIGRDWQLDKSVRGAIPGGLKRFVDSIDLTGAVAFDCSTLQVALGLPADIAATQPVPADAFDATVWLRKASFDAGAPVTDAEGVMKLAGTIEKDDLKTLAGTLQFDVANVAGREVSRMTADVRKSADKGVLQISKIDAHLAGGVVAGRVETVLDKADPRFAISLQIRDANVGELTGDVTPAEAKGIGGKLSGSLTMEGRWDDASTRRGRGDVIVQGRDMYRVPVVFGLMQIANLSLPNDAPLSRAGLRYSIDGQRMSLEQIDLRSANSAMQGTGTIDFGTRKVAMTLALADSPADSVPVFGPLFRTARQDLLQIKVRGTLSEPTVKAQAFNTFTSTVDEVLKGKQQ